jgi:hypothetical protein
MVLKCYGAALFDVRDMAYWAILICLCCFESLTVISCQRRGFGSTLGRGKRERIRESEEIGTGLGGRSQLRHGEAGWKECKYNRIRAAPITFSLLLCP